MRIHSLYLEKAKLADLKEIVDLFGSSKYMLEPWIYPPACFKSYLSDQGRYFLRRRIDKSIVGTFGVSGIIRGPLESAFLGFNMFHPWHNMGLMSEGLPIFIRHVFTTLNLHRLEANIQPHNFASKAVVRKAGFALEGYSRDYLNVGYLGWKDHERWAILNSDWRSTR